VEIPGGRGVIKDPLGTEIPKGWGMQTKNLPWEGYGYFLEPHICVTFYNMHNTVQGGEWKHDIERATNMLSSQSKRIMVNNLR